MRQTACARRFLPAMIGGGTWEGAHARHEAARVRQPVRRRGGSMASRGEGAAAGDAGDRVPRRAVGLDELAWVERFRQGLSEPDRSRAKTSRSSTGGRRDQVERLPRLRPSSSASRSMLFTRRTEAARSPQSGDSTHPYRLCDGGRPGQRAWSLQPGRPGGNVTGLSNFQGSDFLPSAWNFCAR